MRKNVTDLSLVSQKKGNTIHWHYNTSLCESWSGVNRLGEKAELTFQRKYKPKHKFFTFAYYLITKMMKNSTMSK